MFSSEMMRLNCLIKVYYVHHLQVASSSPDLKRIDMNVGLSVSHVSSVFSSYLRVQFCLSGLNSTLCTFNLMKSARNINQRSVVFFLNFEFEKS